MVDPWPGDWERSLRPTGWFGGFGGLGGSNSMKWSNRSGRRTDRLGHGRKEHKNSFSGSSDIQTKASTGLFIFVASLALAGMRTLRLFSFSGGSTANQLELDFFSEPICTQLSEAKQGYCIYRVRVKRGDRKKRVAGAPGAQVDVWGFKITMSFFVLNPEKHRYSVNRTGTQPRHLGQGYRVRKAYEPGHQQVEGPLVVGHKKGSFLKLLEHIAGKIFQTSKVHLLKWSTTRLSHLKPMQQWPIHTLLTTVRRGQSVRNLRSIAEERVGRKCGSREPGLSCQQGDQGWTEEFPCISWFQAPTSI